MVVTKRLLLRFFFGLEIIIFTVVYFFGAQGVQALMRLKNENAQLAFEVNNLDQSVKELQSTVLAWQDDPFYKEQAARETLHMARKDDRVYLMG